MSNNETFLSVATEENPEPQGAGVFTVPNYIPGSNDAFARSLSVETGGIDQLYPNGSADQHVLCCNCCCDFRRAVLVVNGISIVLKLVIILGMAIGASYVGNNLDEIESDIQDDDAREQMDAFVKTGGMAIVETVLEALETISIGLHACGIYGALNFKQWGIITAGVAYTVQLLVGLVTMDIYNIVLSASFLYPHWFMYKLMRAGVMTDSNYHNIASCCGDRRM